MWIKSDSPPNYGDRALLMNVSYYSPSEGDRIFQVFNKQEDKLPSDATDIYWHYIDNELPWEHGETLGDVLTKFLNTTHGALSYNMPCMAASTTHVHNDNAWKVDTSLTKTSKGGFIMSFEVTEANSKAYYKKSKEFSRVADTVDELLSDMEDIVDECEKNMVKTTYESSYSYESKHERRYNPMECEDKWS